MYDLLEKRQEKPPPNRSTSECEEQLRLFYQYHQAKIYNAVAVCHSESTKEMLFSVLINPASHNKEQYYDVIRASFTLGRRELQEGIRNEVKEFFEN
jgi:hypothetical protein